MNKKGYIIISFLILMLLTCTLNFVNAQTYRRYRFYNRYNRYNRYNQYNNYNRPNKYNNNQKTLCIVRKGDSLWKISREYKVDFSKIIETNTHFENPDLIYPGDKVYAPPMEQPDNNVNQPPTNDNQPKQPDTRTKEPKDDQDNRQTPTNNLKAMEMKVVELVNQERKKRGLKPYTHNSKLSSVARTKSEDMRDKNYFSHNSPTYGSPFEMLTQFDIKYSAAGENIAKGQRTAQEVMNSWMNSSGHRKNILSGKYTQIGVGVAQDSQGVKYWTQMFIRP